MCLAKAPDQKRVGGGQHRAALGPPAASAQVAMWHRLFCARSGLVLVSYEQKLRRASDLPHRIGGSLPHDRLVQQAPPPPAEHP